MQSSSKKPWFKAKNYGWGWYPATWQGWVITLLFVGLIANEAGNLSTDTESTPYTSLKIFTLACILIGICYKTGEKPYWRWGKEKNHSKK